MPRAARLICESCSQRLASFDEGALDVSAAVRVVVPRATSDQHVTIVLICRCGTRRPWVPGNFEVKAGRAVSARR